MPTSNTRRVKRAYARVLAASTDEERQLAERKMRELMARFAAQGWKAQPKSRPPVP